MDSPPSDDADHDDPWTFFGLFSEEEIAGASELLKEAGVKFTVQKTEKSESVGGWSGP
jgi:hypothetical protein